MALPPHMALPHWTPTNLRTLGHVVGHSITRKVKSRGIPPQSLLLSIYIYTIHHEYEELRAPASQPPQGHTLEPPRHSMGFYPASLARGHKTNLPKARAASVNAGALRNGTVLHTSYGQYSKLVDIKNPTSIRHMDILPIRLTLARM